MDGSARLFLDVHLIQTVPPSCVNRDDTGSPKTAVYGGVARARISSQSWKRSMRLAFRDTFSEDRLGHRTKKIVALVADEIRALGGGQPEADARKVLETAGLKIKSEDKGTDALFFISAGQARALAELIVRNPEADKKTAQAALRQNPSVDIALFGRMVADDPTLNNDACAQVAHAISTYRVANEYDYFTAVDDMSPEDNAGTGHIGTVELNAATLYRYATVALHELSRQLGGGAVDVAREFVRAFATSMPTGKQNTFANRTLPDAMLVTLRADQPLNLVGAFEKPVPASDEGYVAASARRLVTHAQALTGSFAGVPEASYVVGDLLGDLGEAASMQSWGLDAKYDRRGTERAPTKSGVVGLVAAALGRRRDADIGDLAALRFGVRVDREGVLLRDYHTAKSSRSAYVTNRYYLCDAAFLAGLEGDDALLREIERTLASPQFPLFLGRRSCPPEGRVSLGLRGASQWEALAGEPPLSEGGRARLRILLDGGTGESARFACDLPLSLDQRRREYGFRSVREAHVETAATPAQRPTLHDPMRELEG